jgi:L-proline amide hydrolase
MNLEWSMIERCSAIKVPTLVIHGEYDFADTSAVEPWVEGIEGAKWITMKDCSHISLVEKPKEHGDHVYEFLRG